MAKWGDWVISIHSMHHSRCNLFLENMFTSLVLLLTIASRTDGGQGQTLSSHYGQSCTVQLNRIECLVNNLKEGKRISDSFGTSMKLRGGDSLSSQDNEEEANVGCGKCITFPGRCPACGKSKTMITPQLLEVGSVLGHGSFSTVHLATSSKWGEVAVKKIVVVGDDHTVMKRLSREIQILSRLKHPNIIRLLDVHYEESASTRSASLLFEACRGGELFDFVNGIDVMCTGERKWQDLRYGMEHANASQAPVTEGDLSRIVRQILLAVAYLHENKIAHRDLKLENILLQEPFSASDSVSVKLIDFGFSKGVTEDERMFTACGSTLYIAPEVLAAKETGKGYGLECDAWAVGIMSYILLTCNPPFAGATPVETLASIRTGVFAFPQNLQLSQEARDFVRRLLVADPVTRATCQSALSHPWITLHARGLVDDWDDSAQGVVNGWNKILWGCVPRALRDVPHRLSTFISHQHHNHHLHNRASAQGV